MSFNVYWQPEKQINSRLRERGCWWGEGGQLSNFKVGTPIPQLKWEDLGQSLLGAGRLKDNKHEVGVWFFFLSVTKGNKRQRHFSMHISQSHGLLWCIFMGFSAYTLNRLYQPAGTEASLTEIWRHWLHDLNNFA